MKAQLGVLTLMALVFAGCSGTEVQGIVREEGTGEPLSGASVQVGDQISQTDAEGEFALDVDDDAPATLDVKAAGYEPQKIDVSMADGDALPTDVTLKKESTERQETRARLVKEQARLDAWERKHEDQERRLYEARRGFELQGVPAEQRAQALQQLDAWQTRLDADEDAREVDERALYEARRDFDSHAIDTWTPSEAANRVEDSAEDAQDALEDRADDAKDASEDAADAIRKADEEAADRADDAKDE